MEKNTMSTATLEQIKINVTDANTTAKILCGFFNWKVQWSEYEPTNTQTIQIGNEASQLVLTSSKESNLDKDSHTVLTHIGIAVENINKVKKDVINAGLETYGHYQNSVRNEFYFRDHDKIEYLIRGNTSSISDWSREWIKELAKMSEHGALMK